jgi:hypothetical protein
MNIADSLILLVPMDDKKQLLFLCWSHGLNQPWLVCRAVDPLIVRVVVVWRAGVAVEGAILGQFEKISGQKEGVILRSNLCATK